MEESDSMTQDKSWEKSLEMDADCLSFHTDSGDSDKALTLVRSVLTQRRQAMQVRLLSQLPPQIQGVSRPMCVIAS